ncbi:hypothetical protein LXL04_032868 [Taraxacum kok-saghyz]
MNSSFYSKKPPEFDLVLKGYSDAKNRGLISERDKQLQYSFQRINLIEVGTTSAPGPISIEVDNERRNMRANEKNNHTMKRKVYSEQDFMIFEAQDSLQQVLAFVHILVGKYMAHNYQYGRITWYDVQELLVLIVGAKRLMELKKQA